LIPEFLMRFIVWALVHSIYRIGYQDLHHIPEQGPGLLWCREGGGKNVFLIAAACRRPVRFLVPEHLSRRPLLGFVLRAGKAIVMGPEGAAAQAIAAALEAGHLLCLMGEGGPALQAVVAHAPVIPITVREAAGGARLMPRLELLASPAGSLTGEGAIEG
jgi:hypothetical protein